MRLKLDCGAVVIELTIGPTESLGAALDEVLSRAEPLSRLFQVIDELDDGDDDDDEDRPSSPGDDDCGGATVDVDRLLSTAGIPTG